MLVGVLLKAVGGSRAERVIELPRVSAISNTALGDTGALVPCGPQMGALTLAGGGQAETDWVASFVIQCAPPNCICPTEHDACVRRHCWRLPACRLGSFMVPSRGCTPKNASKQPVSDSFCSASRLGSCFQSIPTCLR